MEHTAAALQKAWQDIFPALAGQGVQIDTSRPVLERYIPRMVNAHICEICVPVL
jgi:DNA gyrase inhibitor GyrI